MNKLLLIGLMLGMIGCAEDSKPSPPIYECGDFIACLDSVRIGDDITKEPFDELFLTLEYSQYNGYSCSRTYNPYSYNGDTGGWWYYYFITTTCLGVVTHVYDVVN